MIVKAGKEKDWQKHIEINSKNSYGKAIIDFIESWTGKMEEEIKNNPNEIPENIIKNCINKFEFECDTMGLSGVGFNIAVNVVKELWKYGDIVAPLYDGPFFREGI